MSRTLWRFPVLVVAVVLGTGGCENDRSAVSPMPDPRPAGDTSVGHGDLTPGSPFRGFVTNVAAAMDPLGRFARVSMPPGTMKNVVSATIVNRRTGLPIPVRIVDAGFDPVPIIAEVGDTIVVTFGFISGETTRTWAVVPVTRRPVVIRSDPQSLKRDVALNASVRIVFSEPLDPSSVNTTTIVLTRNGVAVTGVVEVLPQEPWIALFTPTAPLADETTFELLVTDQVRDLDGEGLESPTALSFTTIVSARPGEERVAFESWNGGRPVIYTMRPDGSRLVEVTEGYDPSFSPDGAKIAFWRYGKGSGTIFVANVDGSNPIELAEGEQPTWSPDSRRLAFGCGGICVVNVDGTGMTRITPPAPTSADGQACVRDTDPTWSPDGSTIAFTRWPDSRIPTSMCLPLAAAFDFPFDFWTQVWLVDVDGSKLRPVRDSVGDVATYAGWPSWSPDGKRLAFYHLYGKERIAIAGPDGSWISNVVDRPITSWDNLLGSPAWSPDGTRLLFATADGWGFADASASGHTETVRSSISIVPYPFSWSWSRR